MRELKKISKVLKLGQIDLDDEYLNDDEEEYGTSWIDDVDRLTETFINGNRKDVLEELDAMPQNRAMAVAVHILDQLETNYDIGYFMRMLSDRV